MLHIAICDDEKEFVTYLTELVNRYAAETGEEIKVSAFYDGMELTTHYDTTIDLIFLDIQMKMVNGLRTAERIRQMDEKVGIIFLTTLTQCALEGYKYQVANYIINRNLLLHTEQGNIICYRSMKELEQELAPHGFVRCHTSYIVNLFFVKGVKKLEITLVTGETIPISQPKRRQFMEQLVEYWGDLLRFVLWKSAVTCWLMDMYVFFCA